LKKERKKMEEKKGCVSRREFLETVCPHDLPIGELRRDAAKKLA